jgi:hypothetical protein
MQSHLSAVLLSPRRYGKTSILLRAERRLSKAERPAIVRANVFETPTATKLAGSLAASAYHLSRVKGRGEGAVDFLRRLRVRPTMSIGSDGKPEFRFDTGVSARDLSQVFEDVFDVLAEFASSRPAVLVIDEFQAIVDIDHDLPSILKGLLDIHPKVSLVAAGSKRHLMERLFVDNNAPLFNMAEKLAIGPIADSEMIDFLRKRARGVGKPFAKGAAERVVEIAGPVPDDIQHLAWAAFEESRDVESITVHNVHGGLRLVIGHHSQLYADLLTELTAGQRAVVVQLASAPTAHPNSGEFVRRTGLANNTSVRTALTPLVENQLVEVRDGVYCVADPFWAASLKDRYFSARVDEL